MKKFSLHPIFVVVWVWMILVLGPLTAGSYALAIIIHEYGHFLVAKCLGYKLSKFSLSPYGVSLSYLEQSIDRSDEVKIAVAGPLANLISALFVVGFWWIFPNFYFISQAFVLVSVTLALFNFLPAYPLDGGRLFIAFSSNFIAEKTAKKLTIILNLILSVFFLILFMFFMFINFNPTYFLFAFFLIVGVLDLNFVTKFEKINIFKKNNKNFAKPVIFCVYEKTMLSEIIKKIQTSKTAVFYYISDSGKVVCLSEKTVIWLASNFDYQTTLGEIFAKKK